MSGTRKVLLAGLAAATVACSGGAPERRSLRAVILITCDTLRADRLGAYGYERDVSPQLDAFSREAVVFRSAYATAPHTNPAISSLLSGRMPDEIGVSGGNRTLMPSAVTTLPEVLRRFDIESAAVVSNWALRRPPPELGDVGVSQGFSHFDDRMASRDGLRAGHRERLAGATTDSAIEWVAGRSDEDAPFFLWVHYQDPHGPYAPPDGYAELFLDEPVSARRLPIGTTSSGLGQIPAYQALAGEQRPDVYRNLYDAEIRYFDSEVGRLFDWLREAGFFADSLVLFTADHGESLGEHDYWFSHEQHLYREVVRVPLIVRYPAGLSRPQDSAVVGHLDVWPTVLDAFDLPAVPSRGTSLLTAPLPADRIAAHTFAPAGDPERWEGVSDGRYRLLTHAGRSRLFDVVADPEERNDLAQAEPRRLAALLGRYEEFMASDTGEGSRDGVDLPLDEESRRALEALGYID